MGRVAYNSPSSTSSPPRRRLPHRPAVHLPRLLFVLSLFAVGCATVAPKSKPEPVFKRPRRVSFQVDPSDTTLWDAMTRAAAAWSYALDAEIVVAEDGDIPVFWVPDVNAEPGCEAPPDRNPGAWSGACSPGAGTADVHIVVNSNAPDMSRLYAWLLHEMGHVLGGRGGHLDDDGADVATPSGQRPVLSRYNLGETDPILTTRDVLYVCESVTRIVECPGPF